MKPTTTNTEGFFKVLHEFFDSDIDGISIGIDNVKGHNSKEVHGCLLYQGKERDKSKPYKYELRFTLTKNNDVK